DQDLVQALGEFVHAVRFQRPGHANLVQANADIGSSLLVDAQVGQRLAGVQVGFAGDDADLRLRRIPDDLVQFIGAAVGQCGVPLVAVHADFHVQHGVGPADIQ